MTLILKASPIVNQTEEILKNFSQTYGIQPKLQVILVGQNPASLIYINNKIKTASRVGITGYLETFHTEQPDLQNKLEKFISLKANDPAIDGILIQLPLPNCVDLNKLVDLIGFQKDVDGFHPLNRGQHVMNIDSFVPCTPLGIRRLIQFYNLPLADMQTLIIGRSLLVGQPTVVELLHRNASVSIAHSRTKNITAQLKNYDLIITATGNLNCLSWNDLLPGQIAIDVGIHRIDDQICGDLGPMNSQSVDKLQAYAPVPGGIGPMTINSLLINCFRAACINKKLYNSFINLKNSLAENNLI